MPKGNAGAFAESELLTLDEIAGLVSVFAGLGIRKVRLTGGEPLLRKGVPNLVRRLKAVPGIAEVVLTTNGLLLARHAQELKDAGLDRVNVSLDTLDRENFTRITGADKFHEVLAGLEAARRAGLAPVKMNVVLMKGVNDGEIPALVRFAVERDFEIRFIEWMPTLNEIGSIRESRFLPVEAARKIIEAEYTLRPDDSNPHAPARTFFLRGTRSKAGFISPLSNAFCSSCNRLRLKANGKMKTCLHGEEDLDLGALVRRGATADEIRQAILPVVFNRPEEHFLNNPAVAHKDFLMTAVGG